MIKKYLIHNFKSNFIRYFFAIFFLSICLGLFTLLPTINEKYQEYYYQNSQQPDFIIDTSLGIKSNFFNNSNNYFALRNNNVTLDFLQSFINKSDLIFPSNQLQKTYIGIDVLAGPFYYSPIKNNITLIAHSDLQNNLDYYIKSTFILSDTYSFNQFLKYYSLQENQTQTFVHIQRRDSPKFISDNMSLDVKTNNPKNSIQITDSINLQIPDQYEYINNEQTNFLPYFASTTVNTEIFYTSFNYFKNFLLSTSNLSVYFNNMLFEYHLLFNFHNDKNLNYLIGNAKQETDLLSINSFNYLSNEWQKIASNPYNLKVSIISAGDNFVTSKLSEVNLSLVIITNVIYCIFFLLFIGLLLFYRNSMGDLKEDNNFKKMLEYLELTGFPRIRLFEELNYLLTILISLCFLLNDLFFIIIDQLNLLSINSSYLFTLFIINFIISILYFLLNYLSFIKNFDLFSIKITFKVSKFSNFKPFTIFYFFLAILVLISYIFLNISYFTYDAGFYSIDSGFFDLYSFLIIGLPNLFIGLIILLKFPQIVLSMQFFIQKLISKSEKSLKKFSLFILSALRSPSLKSTLSIELILFCSFVFVPLYFIQFQQTILQTDDDLNNGADLNLKIAFHNIQSLNQSTNDLFQFFENLDVFFTPYVLFDVYLSSGSYNIYPVTSLALNFKSLQFISMQGFNVYDTVGNNSYQNNSLFFSKLRYEAISKDFPNSEADFNFGLNSLSKDLVPNKYVINGFYLNFPKLENTFSSSLSSMLMNISLYFDLEEKNNINSVTLETGYLIWFKEDLNANHFKEIDEYLNNQDITHDFSRKITGSLNKDRQTLLDNIVFLGFILGSIFLIIFLLIFELKLNLFSSSVKEINVGLFSQNVDSKQLLFYNISLITIYNVCILVGSNIFAFGFNYAWQSILKLFVTSINDRLWYYHIILISNFILEINLCIFLILTLFSYFKIRSQLKTLKLEVA